jgi:hypothetical protein
MVEQVLASCDPSVSADMVAAPHFVSAWLDIETFDSAILVIPFLQVIYRAQKKTGPGGPVHIWSEG